MPVHPAFAINITLETAVLLVRHSYKNTVCADSTTVGLCEIKKFRRLTQIMINFVSRNTAIPR